MCGVLLQVTHGVGEVITEGAEDSERGWDSERKGQVGLRRGRAVRAGMLSFCPKEGRWNTTQAQHSL